MKSRYLLTTTAAIALAAWATGANAASKWDGGDELADQPARMRCECAAGACAKTL